MSSYEIVYTNSSGNIGGSITFENLILMSDEFLLGFYKSPQYEEADPMYLYSFGSSGIASTAGKIELFEGGELIDEVCWGKIECSRQIQKFSTSEESNLSWRKDGDVYEKYYPELNEEALYVVSEIFESCDGLVITEIFSYYESSQLNQFIELYNETDETILLDNCSIEYKSRTYPLEGSLDPNAYYLVDGNIIQLTKNPTSSLKIDIVDKNKEIVDSVTYYNGQRKNTSYAKFGDEWQQTYSVTPGESNVFQEFQSCPEGKVINELTGNCVKEIIEKETVCPDGKYLNPSTGRCKNIETETVKVCKDGYYLNILTNRCKKNPEEEHLAACAEGYERNPETNRCRKIRQEVTDEYVPENDGEKTKNPKIFIASIAVIVLLVSGVIVLIYQYRGEIKKLYLKIVMRRKI